MRKISCLALFMGIFFIAQLAFGDVILSTITLTGDPEIPTIKGKAAAKLQEVPIAGFDYAGALSGKIGVASIEGNWGGKNITPITKLSLYLDNKLLIDFNQYYKDLSKTDKKLLRQALRRGETIPFDISIDEADLTDGQLYLVGKPRFFRKLNLEPLTLRIVDLVSDNPQGPTGGNGQPGNLENDPTEPPGPPTGKEDDPPGGVIEPGDGSDVGTQATPEPVSILLLGSGLIGLAGYMRKKFF